MKSMDFARYNNLIFNVKIDFYFLETAIKPLVVLKNR